MIDNGRNRRGEVSNNPLESEEFPRPVASGEDCLRWNAGFEGTVV